MQHCITYLPLEICFDYCHFVILTALTYTVFKAVPKGFIPTEDQGYIMITEQSPSGASLEYTTGISHQVEAILRQQPEVQDIFSVASFSFAGAAPNYAIVFIG